MSLSRVSTSDTGTDARLIWQSQAASLWARWRDGIDDGAAYLADLDVVFGAWAAYQRELAIVASWTRGSR